MAEAGKFNKAGALKKTAGKSTDKAPIRKAGGRDEKGPGFREGQSVELIVGSRTDLGYMAVINGSREGLLYKNEVFQTLRKGQRIEGFIKKVREDGKIDLCLQRPGSGKVDDLSERILDALRDHDGFIPATDKSAPEFIYRMFGASKKTYKKAIGALYKKRLINILSNGIELLRK